MCGQCRIGGGEGSEIGHFLTSFMDSSLAELEALLQVHGEIEDIQKRTKVMV